MLWGEMRAVDVDSSIASVIEATSEAAKSSTSDALIGVVREAALAYQSRDVVAANRSSCLAFKLLRRAGVGGASRSSQTSTP